MHTARSTAWISVVGFVAFTAPQGLLVACPVTECAPKCGPSFPVSTLDSAPHAHKPATPAAVTLSTPTPGEMPVNTPALNASDPQFRVRRNQKDIGAAGRQLYVDAVKALKAAPKQGTDARASNRYDEYVLQHGDKCEHANSGFLPWHRKLLWEFEQDVRALAGPSGNPNKYKNFTVPYWDWTREAFPSDLATPGDNNFLGPNGDATDGNKVKQGPFRATQWTTLEDAPDLKRNFNNIGQLTANGPAAFTDLLTKATFQAMSEKSEEGPELHDQAHVRVGGQLGAVSSGADEPAFFLLHSFVDLMWAKWQVDKDKFVDYQQFGGGPALADSLDGFGAGNLGFGGTTNNKTEQNLNFYDGTTLGYTYDYLGTVLVPEPTSAALVFGLAGLLLARHRTRRAA